MMTFFTCEKDFTEWAIPKDYNATDRAIGRRSNGGWFVHEYSSCDEWDETTPFDTFKEAMEYLNKMTNRD